MVWTYFVVAIKVFESVFIVCTELSEEEPDDEEESDSMNKMK
jgi:hypothetical protein